MAGPEQFGRLSIWGILSNLAYNNVGFFTTSVATVDSTTFAGKAGPGSLLFHLTSGAVYVNNGTKATPIWVAMNGPRAALGGLGPVGNAKMTYDFAVNGGAISTITPSNSPTLPTNAIILGGTIDITTTLTSGGAATIAVGLGSGAQIAALLGATAVASWTAGQLALIPVFTAATYVKVAASTPITMTIAAAALTAGKFDVNLVYVIGN